MREPKQRTLFAQQVVNSRQAMNLSQEMLAEDSGISLRTIQRIERGAVRPQPFTVKALADALGCSFTIPEAGKTEANRPDEHNLNYMPLKLMILSSLCFVLPLIANILIPFIIWYRNRQNAVIRRLGGVIISFQILWTIVTFMLVAITPGIATLLLGTSNPGQFHPVLMMYVLMLAVNVFALVKMTLKLNDAECAEFPMVPNLL